MSTAQQQPTANGAAASAEAQKIGSQEVGWMFAQEYYTIMNKDPSQMHCFYAKKSTCIHGTEGDVVKQANGQQEIHAAISAEDFKGCKVLVTNVDTLPSINGSILVQVIGEMSNNEQPSRRFAQTFFLAEQKGGYYVHNDILRYLKDDTEDREALAASTAAASAPKAEEKPAAAATPAEKPEPVEPKKDEKVDADEEKKDEAAAPKAVEAAAPVETKPAPAEPAAAVSKPESKPKSPKERPAAAAAAAPKAEEKPVPAPTPAKPATWANLAASDSKKWGSTIAKIEGTVAPATAASVNANPHSDASSRVSTPGSGAREHRRKNDALSVFAKNIPQGSTIQAIKNACKDFGPIAYVDYSPNKPNGIIEFSTDTAKQAALRAGSFVVNGATVAIEERRQRQSSGRRDGGANKQSSAQGSPAPARNGSGEFERVGSGRGSRSRNANQNNGSNRTRSAKQQ
ncbi:hypothetical protein GQ54DRAFT_254919 [Martensiomyces pterosporus]|nr:hypothetical protein GQ54DRAFT_254919 [Martensiomyces pterosporus]